MVRQLLFQAWAVSHADRMGLAATNGVALSANVGVSYVVMPRLE